LRLEIKNNFFLLLLNWVASPFVNKKLRIMNAPMPISYNRRARQLWRKAIITNSQTASNSFQPQNSFTNFKTHIMLLCHAFCFVVSAVAHVYIIYLMHIIDRSERMSTLVKVVVVWAPNHVGCTIKISLRNSPNSTRASMFRKGINLKTWLGHKD